MPTVFVQMAVVMGGLFWVIERRERLASERAAQAQTEADAASPDGEGVEAAADAADSESGNTSKGAE